MNPPLAITPDTILFMRGAGPVGYPGAAEVVNMRPPAYLITEGHRCAAVHRRRAAIGHQRQPVDPQRQPGSGCAGGLALLQTGDKVRVDLG